MPHSRSLLPLLFTVLIATPALATVADDLCAPIDDPCVVSGTVAIDPGSTIDLDGRGLQLAPTAIVSWTGTVTIQDAADCDFQPGSKLFESAPTPGVNLLWLFCSKANLAGTITTLDAGILVEGSAMGDGPYVLSGTIKAKGDDVASIAVDAIGGDITVSGKIQATSKVTGSPSEFRLISNFGNITIATGAKIQLKGVTASPSTEAFWVEAGTGTLTVDGTIDARAKTGGYGINLEANGAVNLGVKSMVNATSKGTGAEVAINSQVSSVTLRGTIKAKTGGVQSPSQGPKLRVCAGDDATIEGTAKLDASAGSAGSIIVGAFDRARANAGAKITSKKDGDIELCGGTSGSIAPKAKVVPEPWAVGTFDDAGCLSPESGVIFFLDCNAG